jgi:acyl-CoA reductase-like NAD-dependent aldehyde dehydrogenase
LGGKDAMIICHDAPLERAANAAIWGGLLNAGQMCISVERIIVDDQVYEQFVSLLKDKIKNVTIGGPQDDCDMGPINFSPQLAVIERHIEQAVSTGAKLVHGGQRMPGKGQFFEPTLLVDITQDMDIYREETFGPVLPVIRAKDEEHAISLANDHKYGLTGSVWTKDIKRGKAIASRLECGQILINDLITSEACAPLPFGGVKSSGFGRYHGPDGLLAFSHTRAVFIDNGKNDKEPFWYPYKGKYPFAKEVFLHILKGRLFKAFMQLRKM